MIHIVDFHRELGKIYSTLLLMQKHLDSKDQMNAALHMSGDVRSTPLASAISRDIDNLRDLMDRLSEGVDNTPS